MVSDQEPRGSLNILLLEFCHTGGRHQRRPTANGQDMAPSGSCCKGLNSNIKYIKIESNNNAWFVAPLSHWKHEGENPRKEENQSSLCLYLIHWVTLNFNIAKRNHRNWFVILCFLELWSLSLWSLSCFSQSPRAGRATPSQKPWICPPLRIHT